MENNNNSKNNEVGAPSNGMDSNKIVKIAAIVIALIVIGFLSYLIFIKKQIGRAPAGFIQPVKEFSEFTEEEKIDILEGLLPTAEKDLSDSKTTEQNIISKGQKRILENLSPTANNGLSNEEKFKILESLTQ